MIDKATEPFKALPRGRVAGAATPPEVGRHAMQRPGLFALQALVEEGADDRDNGSAAHNAGDPGLINPDAEARNGHSSQRKGCCAKLPVTDCSDVAPQGSHLETAPVLAFSFPRFEDALRRVGNELAELLKDSWRRKGTLPELVDPKPGSLRLLGKLWLCRWISGSSTPGHVRARDQSRGAYRHRSVVHHRGVLQGRNDAGSVRLQAQPARWTQARPGRQGSCRRASSAYDRVG